MYFWQQQYTTSTGSSEMIYAVKAILLPWHVNDDHLRVAEVHQLQQRKESLAGFPL